MTSTIIGLSSVTRIVGRSAASATGSAGLVPVASGSVKANVEPLPGVLSTRPSRHALRPAPCRSPGPGRCRRRRGSRSYRSAGIFRKIRPCCSGAMPRPRSRTAKQIVPGAASARSVTRCPGFENLIAFESRFVSTWKRSVAVGADRRQAIGHDQVDRNAATGGKRCDALDGRAADLAGVERHAPERDRPLLDL